MVQKYSVAIHVFSGKTPGKHWPGGVRSDVQGRTDSSSCGRPATCSGLSDNSVFWPLWRWCITHVSG